MSREIETKLLAQGGNYEAVNGVLLAILSPSLQKLEGGNYISSYWRTAQNMPAKFVRLNVGSYTDLCAKVKDNNNNDDRAEYQVNIEDKYKDDMMELLTVALGDPVPLMLRYTDYTLSKGVCISVVQNLEHPKAVFVEVEAPTQQEVDFWVAKISKQESIAFAKVKNSMFEIFVLHQGIIT